MLLFKLLLNILYIASIGNMRLKLQDLQKEKKQVYKLKINQ